MINRKTILFVDGYNIINAWSNLKTLMNVNLANARNKLNDYMFEYAVFYDEEVWIVYDAYLTSYKKEKIDNVNNVYIVFTKENQTADSFIEKKAKEYSNDTRILLKLASADWAHQRQVLGSGGIRLAPWELKEKCKKIRLNVVKNYKHDNKLDFSIESRLSKKMLQKLNEISK